MNLKIQHKIRSVWQPVNAYYQGIKPLIKNEARVMRELE